MGPRHQLSTSRQVAGGNPGMSEEAHGLWQPGDVLFSLRDPSTSWRGAPQGLVKEPPIPSDREQIQGSQGCSLEAVGESEVVGGRLPWVRWKPVDRTGVRGAKLRDSPSSPFLPRRFPDCLMYGRATFVFRVQGEY
jgi:hypothetical protein